MSGVIGHTGSRSGIIGITETSSEVLLNTYTANNSSNIIEITGMSTIYKTYKFIVSQLKPATDSIHVYWFLKNSGGTVRSSGYVGSGTRVYYNGSGSGSGVQIFGDTLFGNDSDLSNAHTYSGCFYVFDPMNASEYTHGTAIYNYVNDSSYNMNMRTGSHFTTKEAHPAINLQTQSGNWHSGTVKMYGIK